MLERPRQDRDVGPLQSRRGRGGILGVDGVPVRVEQRLAGAEEPVREHRHDRERDEERRRHRDRDRERERPEQLAGHVAHEGDGQEDRDRGEGRGGDGHRDLAHREEDRPPLVRVSDVVPLDVLDHDDRVVHHAPDRDRERAEGEDVQRVPERLDPDERDEDARGDRDRGHQGGADR
ncbi:hypothetical protein ABE10_01275, partial [Bacillus toyonensis]|nr:hypothetical protein [Bacillus toyonensis]